MVISKKYIISKGFRGGPTLSRWGVQLFPGGAGGPNANFYRNPYNLLFSRGVRTPYPPPPPPLDHHLIIPLSLQTVQFFFFSKSLFTTEESIKMQPNLNE